MRFDGCLVSLASANCSKEYLNKIWSVMLAILRSSTPASKTDVKGGAGMAQEILEIMAIRTMTKGVKICIVVAIFLDDVSYGLDV